MESEGYGLQMGGKVEGGAMDVAPQIPQSAERHCPHHMTRKPKKAVWEAEIEEMEASKSHTGWMNLLSLLNW